MAKKDTAEKVKGLFAFWRYDLYPYVCGAEITMMDSDGRVYAPSYQGWAKPFKIMPAKAGRALLERLKRGVESLEYQRRVALEKFENEWDAKLFELLPEARHPNISRHNPGDKEA